MSINFALQIGIKVWMLAANESIGTQIFINPLFKIMLGEIILTNT